jgi:anti-sigma B factor antagonist
VPDSKPAPDKVWVAMHRETALIIVQGRGSFKFSTAMKHFGQAAVDGGCHAIVLDMSECIGMDSTFMGVLAGLATRLKQRDGELVLLNLAARTRSLIATLGLDQIVQAYMPDNTPDRYREVQAMRSGLSELQSTAPKGVTAETMLEAHENLVQLSPDNAPRFKDVVAFLREDLKRKTESGLD